MAKTEVDASEQKVDAKSSDTNPQPKVYHEDLFKEVVKQRDDIKEKLRLLEGTNAANLKKIEEETMVSKGEYEKLISLKKNEFDTAIASAKKTVIESHLISLGIKYGILDPSDMKLFDSTLELDEFYRVKNTEELEKSFVEWKKKKPYLFKTEDKKPVPKTDNSIPQHNLNANPSGKISIVEILQDRALQKSKGN